MTDAQMIAMGYTAVALFSSALGAAVMAWFFHRMEKEAVRDKCPNHKNENNPCSKCALEIELSRAGHALRDIALVLPEKDAEWRTMHSERMVALFKYVRERARKWNQ